MELVVDTRQSIPIVAQLFEQICSAFLRGEIGTGSALPSIRQLANDLGLDPSTVGKTRRPKSCGMPL